MNYILILLSQVCIYAIIVASLDLLVGYAGRISLGQAAFAGVGAYTTAIILTSVAPNLFLAVIPALVLAAVIAGFIGVLTLRLAGDYFVLGTLGLAMIAESIFKNWESVTNGVFGIFGIPSMAVFGMQVRTPTEFFIVCLIVTCLVLFLKQRLISSPFGLTLQMSREDEIVASSLGKDPVKARILLFMFSGVFAAIGGVLMAYLLRFIEPALFGLPMTILVFAALFVGGCASWIGNILGPLLLLCLPEMLRFAGIDPQTVAHLREVMYGLLLIALTLFRPQGIAGKYVFR